MRCARRHKRLIDRLAIEGRVFFIDHDEIVPEVAEYLGGVAARRLDETAAQLFAGHQPLAE